MSDDAYTADCGRIVVEEHIRGELWSGHRGDTPLVVALRDFSYANNPAFFDEWLRFDLPGIAPLAFLGYPDGDLVTAEELHDRRLKGRTATAILAEVRPDGSPLATAAPLSEPNAVTLGLALCDVLDTWIARRGSALVGLRPETIYLDDAKRYNAATPRIFWLLGNGEANSAFDAAYYGGPLGATERELGTVDAAFLVGLLVWFAATGKHAIRYHAYLMTEPLPAFSGSPRLGDVLREAIDVNGTMGLSRLRVALEQVVKPR